MTASDETRKHIHHERRQVLLFRGAIVGVAAGIVAVLFQLLVRVTETGVAGLRDNLGFAKWVVMPLVGALLGGGAAELTKRFAPEAAGSGIPHIKAALMNLRKIRPGRLIPVKIGAGLMALASGMSLGREGPTVQIGAAIGYQLGKWLKVSRRSMAPLIASGSGAGLAAAFNAPLAGFLFVMEEMKREMSPLTYGTALVASVSAVAVKRLALGQSPEFHLNNTGFVPLQALPAVLVLGLLVGLMAVAFNKGIMSALEFRDRIKIPRWAYGGAVGLIAGLVLVALPSATGGGHHTAETLLRGEFPAANLLWMLLLLLIVKFFLTITSFSSGVPGGIFAPMLVMGAVLGYGFGVLVNLLPYSLGADPTVFASIGMAAFLAASVRSPLTGVVLIFEMTAEYRLLYALLLCSFVAYLIAERFRNEPIYESLLERDLKKDSSTEHEEGRPNVVDLFIEPDSEMDGKQISELTLPKGCLIVNIERESQHVVPNGRTKIREGDIVTLVSEETTQEEWVKVFESARAP